MKIRSAAALGVLGITLSLASFAAVEVGEVSYSRGVLTGQLDGEPPRLIGRGVGLHNGETLNTGPGGFALLHFNDGTKMTLRPNTTFKIENLDARAGRENALFSLIRGGLRAITGAISKASPKAFRISSSVGTIGVRGTEFDARLCESNECALEEQATGATAERESRVVGRIALLRGRASATEDGETTRVLSTGAAVYERDQIQTGIQSFAVVAFNDQTRITLSPQSAFRIEEHEYNPDLPDENNSFFSFLQGGMRLVTGVIARLNREAFRVATPTATIGVRGTGFDLVCQGDCVSENAMLDPGSDAPLARFLRFFVRPAYAQSAGNGMYAKVWQGSIEMIFSGRRQLLENGRTAFLRNSLAPPVIMPDIPARLRNLQGAPRPDRVDLRQDLFAESDQRDIQPGLYVNVRKGDVVVAGTDGTDIFVGAGEAVRAGIQRVERLGFVPTFQKLDQVPNPARISARSEQILDLVSGRDAGKEDLECTLK